MLLLYLGVIILNCKVGPFRRYKRVRMIGAQNLIRGQRQLCTSVSVLLRGVVSCVGRCCSTCITMYRKSTLMWCFFS